MSSELSKNELSRYNRHIILSEVGMEGQLKLKAARVLIVGAGGLGCPIAQYLVAAGIGTVGIIDDDVVSASNLQRQILFDTRDVGKSKVAVAAEKLGYQNPEVTIVPINERLNTDNALEIVDDYDILVDGTDNFPTRYLLNDAAVIKNKVLVYGSIFKFDGQVSVFNYLDGPTYRCLFPEPPDAGSVPNCAQIGVVGVLPGVVGTLQANEVLKIVLGVGKVLTGKLLCIDLLTLNQQILSFDKVTGPIENLSDYASFCGLDKVEMKARKSWSVVELKAKLDQGEDIQLIDVRERFEYDIAKLENGQLITLNSIPNFVNVIRRDVPVVVYCHHGMRSASAINYLTEEYGFSNLVNLEGGIDSWSIEIDETVARY